jgi:CubicO group peptidase (beta-lactamase class C family)
MAGSHDDAALEKYVLGWKDDWLFTAPGKVMSYSNPGYHLAGLVLARITGKTYADAMRDVLFAPLGMKRTTIRPLEAMTWPLAQGHDVAGGKPVVIRPAADDASNWPAGSVFTNVEDMAKFAAALAEGGAEGLPKSAVHLLTSRPEAVPGNRTRYGYGLILVDWRGIPLWNHGGARAGYGSTISIAPEQRVAVFAIGNRTGAGMQGAVEKAMELMLQPQVPLAQRDPGRKEEADSAFAARVVGRYTNGRTTVQLVSEEGKLTGKLDGRTYAAQKLGADWVALDKGPQLFLVDGAGGRVEYVCFSLRCAARRD